MRKGIKLRGLAETDEGVWSSVAYRILLQEVIWIFQKSHMTLARGPTEATTLHPVQKHHLDVQETKINQANTECNRKRLDKRTKPPLC